MPYRLRVAILIWLAMAVLAVSTTRSYCGLEEAKADPQLLEAGFSGLKPNAFEVQLVRDLAGKMSGARTFIESIETAVPEFYQQVGQRLQAWVAPPPKIVEMMEPEPKLSVEPQLPTSQESELPANPERFKPSK